VSAAEWAPGNAAPDFNLKDSGGHSHTLSSQKGKWVVLEWLNHGCPFVRKHYDSGNMQALQKKYTGKGVVWFSIVSSEPGKQGSLDHAATKEAAKGNKVPPAPTAVLLDPEGTVGHLYGALTTPHMFVIDPQGKFAYLGAIDDKPTTDVADIEHSKNYVAAALNAGMSRQAITVSATKAYGCSVKYKNK
jgi:alkyl hydroperoxide reductase subunit AhpC